MKEEWLKDRLGTTANRSVPTDFVSKTSRDMVNRSAPTDFVCQAPSDKEKKLKEQKLKRRLVEGLIQIIKVRNYKLSELKSEIPHTMKRKKQNKVPRSRKISRGSVKTEDEVPYKQVP